MGQKLEEKGRMHSNYSPTFRVIVATVRDTSMFVVLRLRSFLWIMLKEVLTLDRLVFICTLSAISHPIIPTWLQ
jgi:hypothetical protein